METAQDRPGAIGRFGGRDFALLWSGFTVNTFGTAITGVVLPLVALITLDASTFEVGAVSAAGVAAWLLFGLAAGVWVDRLPRRPLLIACDAARAAALLSVPVAAFLGLLTIAQLMVVAFLIGVGSVFYDIGLQAFVPTVVEPSRLIVANSRLQGSQSVSEVGGPSLGGGLAQLVGPASALLFDVASYVLSASSVLAIRKDEVRAPRRGQPRMIPQIREGLLFVLANPVLRAVTISAAIVNFFSAALETLVIVFLVRTIEVPPGLVGVLLATGGLGGILGAFAAGTMSNRLGDGRALRLAVIAGPLLALLIPLAHPDWRLVVFGIGMAGMSAATVVFAVIARTYRQLVSPPDMLGRATATMRFVSWGVLPFGALSAGALGQALGNRPALLVICAGFLLMPLPILASPLRHARDFHAFTNDR